MVDLLNSEIEVGLAFQQITSMLKELDKHYTELENIIDKSEADLLCGLVDAYNIWLEFKDGNGHPSHKRSF